MAALADLVVGQQVTIDGTIVSIDPIDRHFLGVVIKLTNPESATDVLHNKKIAVDPVQITIVD